MKTFCFLSEGFFLAFLFFKHVQGSLSQFFKILFAFQYNVMGLIVSFNFKAYKAGYRGKGFAFLECFPEDKTQFSYPLSVLLNFLPAIIK